MKGLRDISSYRLTVCENSNDNSTKVDYLNLDEILLDGATQPRVAIDWKHVGLLQEQIEAGQELEPVIVFFDGEVYWLADGFHRWYAHHNQEAEVIPCYIRQGTRRDAILYSVGANAENKPALPRSKQDKRRAVLMLLRDPEWKQWSDREIARLCKVSQPFVSKLRNNLTDNIISDEPVLTDNVISEDRMRVYKTKHGTTAKMKTANIGKAVAPMEESNRLQPRIAHHLKLADAGLVEINSPDNTRINGRLGRIASVSDRMVQVWVRDVEKMAMSLYSLKHNCVEPLPLETEPQLKQVRDRIIRLRGYNLDPFELEILDLLERPVAFTPTELKYLDQIESHHEKE